MNTASAGRSAGDGRWITVPAERYQRWVTRFGDAHQGMELSVVEADPGESMPAARSRPPERADPAAAATSHRVSCVILRGGDGATAACHVPFPPMTLPPMTLPAAPSSAGLVAGMVVDHALASRVVGVILVRRGGYAAGLVRDGVLASSKVGSRHVQGRSSAGGWSQQRFARRRAGQAREAVAAAADAAVRVLAGSAAELDAVVVGGDRQALAALRADDRLASLWQRVVPRSPEVFGTIRLTELRRVVAELSAVHIRVTPPP